MTHSGKARAAAVLTALLLTCSVTGCGNSSSGGNIAENSAAVQESAAENSKSDGESQSGAESKSEDNTDSRTEDSGSEESKSADDSKSADESSKNTPETSAADSKTENSKASDESSKKSDSSSKTESSKSAGGENSNSGSESSEDDDDNTVKPMKYIYLKDTTAQYSGDGIYVEGGKITISKGGHYEISGTLSNGQIYIMTDKKKVKLFLNNASITNKAGAAINCQAAKKLTLSTLAGTVNKLSDGGTHDADKAAVFSEDTVSLEGEGVLEITGVYAHGIESDDDIKVQGGTVRISSTKSGLKSKDGIEINGGTLFCDGGTNGIKTDGYVTITGGSSILIGGIREEKGAILCDGDFTVTGGAFWGIGNTCSMPSAATTTANVLALTFPEAQPENSIVNVMRGSSTVFTMTSPRSYKYVLYSGPSLLSGAEYKISYGGTVSGGTTKNYVTTGGTYSGGTDGGTISSDESKEKVTVHQVQ